MWALHVLGILIADQMLIRYGFGLKSLVFYPKGHPNYPCWLPDYRVNVWIRNAFVVTKGSRGNDRKEDGEMDMS